jgi:hypothetical protein
MTLFWVCFLLAFAYLTAVATCARGSIRGGRRWDVLLRRRRRGPPRVISRIGVVLWRWPLHRARVDQLLRTSTVHARHRPRCLHGVMLTGIVAFGRSIYASSLYAACSGALQRDQVAGTVEVRTTHRHRRGDR